MGYSEGTQDDVQECVHMALGPQEAFNKCLLAKQELYKAIQKTK